MSNYFFFYFKSLLLCLLTLPPSWHPTGNTSLGCDWQKENYKCWSLLFRVLPKNAKEAKLIVTLEGDFAREVEKVSLKRGYISKRSEPNRTGFQNVESEIWKCQDSSKLCQGRAFVRCPWPTHIPQSWVIIFLNPLQSCCIEEAHSLSLIQTAQFFVTLGDSLVCSFI